MAGSAKSSNDSNTLLSLVGSFFYFLPFPSIPGDSVILLVTLLRHKGWFPARVRTSKAGAVLVIAHVRPVHNWRNKMNENKRCPVHLKIRIKGARKYFPIPVPVKVAENQWAQRLTFILMPASTRFPRKFEVDCVRIYQHK